MKNILRNPAVVWLAGLLASLIIRAVLATIRWRYINREPLDELLGRGEGFIGCFWHGRIAVASVLKRLLPGKQVRVLISQSRDGEIIAKAMDFMEMPAIRGSTGEDKGGAGAFRKALRHLRDHGVVAITPDGPRGPAQVMPPGPVAVARSSHAAVFLFGIGVDPGRTMNSWDKHRLPYPFCRGRVVIAGPFHAPRDADEAQLEALRAQWEASFNEAQAQADALAARR